VNRLLLASVGLFLLIACNRAETEVPPWVGDADAWPELKSPVPRDAAIEARIDQLMAQMSLEQKVGQMIQAEIRWVTPEEVRDYHIGSVLNGGGGFPDKNKQSTVADWVALADAFYAASMDTSKGAGVADVLFRNRDGAVNYDFRGKLSFSWPVSTNQLVLNVGDDNYEPLFPFGYGLTYADDVELSNRLPTGIGDEQFGRTTPVKRASCVE
jgi:hypothetical protein